MPARVLVVADDAALMGALSRVLAEAGFHLRLAVPGDEANSVFVQFRPQLVLLDLCSAERDALAWLQLMRVRPDTSNVPVVLLGSGQEGVRDSIEALRLRADDYLQRPLPADQLLQRMSRYLKIATPASRMPSSLIPGPSGSARADLTPAETQTQTWRRPFEAAARPWTPALSSEIRVRLLAPTDGRLAEGELPSLLWSCFTQQVSGRLDVTITGTEVPRALFFEDGRLTGMRSRVPADRFDEFLVQRGLLTSAQAGDPRARAHESSRRVASALAEAGLLKPSELFELTREHLKDRFVALLDATDSTFHFAADTAPQAERLGLDERPEALLWRALRRKYPLARLMPLLGGPSTLLVPAGQDPLDPGAFALRADEAHTLRLLDGAHTLGDLAATSGVREELVYQVAFLAITVGAARLAARGLEVAPDPHASRLREREIDRARILELRRRCLETGYFDMIGLAPSASRAEIEEALQAAHRGIAPERLEEPALADLAPVAEEIRGVLLECAEVLLDERMRERYRAHQGG